MLRPSPSHGTQRLPNDDDDDDYYDGCFGADLPVTSTTGLFFSVDLLVANRISPFVLNKEVAIGANSYFKTGRLLTNDAWKIRLVSCQGRCGKHKSDNNRSETAMVRPCIEKH